MVDNVYAHLAVLYGLAHQHGLVLADVVDGVVYQVVYHLSHPQLVAVDEHLAVLLEYYVQPVAFDQLCISGKDAQYAVCQRERRALDIGCSGLQTRDIQQVADQIVQPGGFVDDYLYIFRGHLAGQVAHDLAVTGYHGQRGAQVVRDVGYQLFLQVVHLFQLVTGVKQIPEFCVTAFMVGVYDLLRSVSGFIDTYCTQRFRLSKVRIFYEHVQNGDTVSQGIQVFGCASLRPSVNLLLCTEVIPAHAETVKIMKDKISLLCPTPRWLAMGFISLEDAGESAAIFIIVSCRSFGIRTECVHCRFCQMILSRDVCKRYKIA